MKDIDNDFEEKIKKGLFGRRKRRTPEEALQEALDNSTPEEPGVPNKIIDKDEELPNEWL